MIAPTSLMAPATRIQAAVSTVKYLMGNRSRVVLWSHLKKADGGGLGVNSGGLELASVSPRRQRSRVPCRQRFRTCRRRHPWCRRWIQNRGRRRKRGKGGRRRRQRREIRLRVN
ncbi:unnamed protein product [Eruca vesicaria subsp. sativa]|uniref:phosphoglycerate kinase n=1 Tax=Eruca vesicaria subsp. sativa TaxID=29727 RepID=A0ABC8JB47_ERUVS|nr:unnamed protein product [Eruca vesicaria subsp. sativa]